MTKAPRIGYIGKNGTLFRADCLDLLRGIEDDTIDLVFTDPPFNLGKDYGTDDYDDTWVESEYRQWCHEWLLELTRVLRPGGALAIYHWPRWLIEIGAWLNTIPTLRYRSLIALKMKSGFPIKGRLHPAHYGILYYVKKGTPVTFNVVRNRTPVCRHCGKEIRDYGGYRKKFDKFEDEDGIPWIQISDLWEDTRPARQDKSRNLKVNELPFHIPERIILMASKPGDVVLDIFGGGGSTYHAAQAHGRYWIGGEVADLTPSLTRFAALWGKKEEKEMPSKVRGCFDDHFIKQVLKRERTKERVSKVQTIDLAAINGDILSKSRIMPGLENHHQARQQRLD